MVFGITGNILKSKLPAVIEKFLQYLIENKIDFVLHDELSGIIDKFSFLSSKPVFTLEQLIKRADILFIFGGDGTILSFVRRTEENEIPILGINLGTLGFLAEIDVTEIYSFVHDLILGNYIIEECIMLEAKISQGEENHRLIAMNDIVISANRTERLRLLDMKSNVNGQYLITTVSDGIIIATPTGSTAYSLSAHGPIISPPCKVIIINPVCPHALTVRPIIIPDDSVFTATINSSQKEAMVVADGQSEFILKTPFDVCIKKSDVSVKLVKKKDNSYYELLRSKLMWGEGSRTNER